MMRLQCIFFVVVCGCMTRIAFGAELYEYDKKNKCLCVRSFQCNSNDIVIESGEGLIDERSRDEKSRIKCTGGKFDGDYVCCKRRSDLEIDPKNPVDPVTERGEIKMACGKLRTVVGDRIFDPEANDLLPVPGEFPWIAAVFRKNGIGEYLFSFTGSLIHPKVILTAAHKLRRKSPSDLKVVLNGEIERPEVGKKSKEERNIVEIIRHEDFVDLKYYNDVALLILDEPYVIGKNRINPICLPPDDINMEGRKCVVAGWGKELQPDGENLLKKVTVPFVKHSKCQEQLRKTRLTPLFHLHKSLLCAGGEKDKDACKGDGGSPLICEITPGVPVFFQAGFVVGGIGCGLENVPALYGNVIGFKEWIVKKLLEKNIKLE